MYSMTYSSLLEDVRRYLERGFTAESDAIVYEQLPRLITLGERRIARELKVQGFIRAVTTPLQAGVAVYLKPDRWRDTVSMSVDNAPLFSRSYEYCRNYWPDEAQTRNPVLFGKVIIEGILIEVPPKVLIHGTCLRIGRTGCVPFHHHVQSNGFVGRGSLVLDLIPSR